MATLSQGVDSMVRLLRGRRSSKNRITIESIAAVNGNGTYTVRGIACAASGTAQLKVGDRVAVMWRDGKPYLILAHQSRRAQFGPHATGTNPILEQLLIVGASGSREIYFRNDKQIVSLDIRSRLPEDPYDVRWGGGADNAFIVQCVPSFKFFIFELNRANHKGAGSAGVSASLVQTVDLGTANITLLDMALESHSSGETIIQEIVGSGSPTVYGLGAGTAHPESSNFSGHLIIKVDRAQLQAGQANIDDGSLDNFLPNAYVHDTAVQYRLFQFIGDFWLKGDGGTETPYKLMLALMVDYVVGGNGTRTGSFIGWTAQESVAHHGSLEIVSTSGDTQWGGAVQTRAGYIINATDQTIVHSGTGAAARTFDNSASGGSAISPILGTEDLFTSLQETAFNPATEGVDLEFSASGTGSTEAAYVPNLLDPTASPFMTEDPLIQTFPPSSSPGPTYYCISGQAAPHSPVFKRIGSQASGGFHVSISTMRMLSCRVLHLDPDPTKTRLWAVLRHDSGEFVSVLPEEYIWAVKVVVLDGNFTVKYVLRDWTRQIYKHGSGVGGFDVGYARVLSANATHVLWREHLGSAPTGNPGVITGAQYVPSFRTLLANIKTGVVRVVTSGDTPTSSTNENAFDALGLSVVGVVVDFFHESKEDDRRCLIAWKLTDPTASDYKDPTLDTAALVADDVLESATKLLDLPGTLAIPTAKHTHGINDREVLGPLSRSEDEDF